MTFRTGNYLRSKLQNKRNCFSPKKEGKKQKSEEAQLITHNEAQTNRFKNEFRGCTFRELHESDSRKSRNK